MTWTCAGCETVNAADADGCLLCDMARAESDRVTAMAPPPRPHATPAGAASSSDELRPASASAVAAGGRGRMWLAWAIIVLLIGGVVLGAVLSSDDTPPMPASADFEASSGADDSDAGGAGEDETSGPSAPAVVLRRHYEHLDAGDYDAAFSLMVASYRRTVVNWPRKRAQTVPNVQVLEIGPTHLDVDRARVYIRFAAHDSYGDTTCRHFAGWALLRLDAGAWRYDGLNTHYEMRERPGGCD